MELAKSAGDEIAVSPEAQGEHKPSQPSVIARFGTFYFQVPKKTSSVEDVVRQLGEEIDKDPRVTSVRLPSFDPKRDRFISFYPAPVEDNKKRQEELLEGMDVERSVDLAHPIHIAVRAPIKNQRTFSSTEAPPTENYTAMWDGMSVVVFWEQSAQDRVPRAGGHVLEEILATAAKAIGGDLYVQGCNPGCDNSFMHTSLRVIRVSDGDDDFEPRSDTYQP